MRGRALLFIITLSTAAAVAQEKERYLSLHPGYTYLSVRDEGMSPLLYSGHHAAVSADFLKISDKKISDLNAGFSYGYIYPSIYTQSTPSYATSRTFSMGYSYLRKAKTVNEKLSWYAGAGINNFSAYRTHKLYTNNAANYEVFSSLSFENKFIYDISPGANKSRFQYRLALPLLSWYLRPAYVSSNVEGLLEEYESAFSAVMKSGKWAAADKLLRLSSEISYTWYIKEKHAVQLSYGWNFYSLRSINPVKSANHTLQAGFMFNF